MQPQTSAHLACCLLLLLLQCRDPPLCSHNQQKSPLSRTLPTPIGKSVLHCIYLRQPRACTDFLMEKVPVL
ncbi:uncharacterized protein BP01DRAFT_359834 [Aspergillus saccharolyticus JOP 1030-1]|uniref:Secreted protein n=1 Tax=Aspergillus saccharolyticus JOP 1030-1 TaxID=1450539 RepID=A0A318ZPJ5_9EURO|nr:hypothetical protein BP01DRAFT_359834 [Aspergillus saccharolyticus JOP 1030-1]PYH42038.1 hypothetical protein BP01DRAFT_359834 [Aspergillus saccharolyticus JOP 1030-1]